MSSQDPNDSINEAIATAMKNAQAIADSIQQMIEQGTEAIGAYVTPLVENPLIRQATAVPGLRWVMAALGQVNVAKVEREIEELRRTYPLETPEQLAQRVIVESAWKAAGVGLATNFLPPLALGLFAIETGAVLALQSQMIYRIATIYGFSPQDPTRRGEVLAIWGLSAGGSGVLKSGLSVVELLPGIGMAVGITSDAALLYGLGYLASRFYEAKQKTR